jgi:hypothetical protein
MEDQPNTDRNAYVSRSALLAENFAKVEPRFAIYEVDMTTPKSYRQECVIALLVKEMQEQQFEVKALKRPLH